MDIYASDEEKAEAIKQWWRDNGRSVIAGIVLGGAAIFGFKYWTNFQQVQAEQASLLYQQSMELLGQAQTEAAASSADQLKARFPDTAYAVFAALQLAQSHVEQEDYATAKAQLEWVIVQAKLAGLRDLARYRLAKLHVNSEAFDEASEQISQAETNAYTSLLAELEGDIAKAQGQAQAANIAYQKALDTLLAEDGREMLLQFKLDDVAMHNES
jgi:predicted negative regulator of RcsB-dependent stress response